MNTTTRTTSKAGPRRTPQRTCVGCRRTGDQSSFVRLVRLTADGVTRVDVDESSRRTAGRGAYLCRDQRCWERGIKGALAASLRTVLDAANRESLLAYAERFAQTESTTAAAGEPGATSGTVEGEHS